LQVVVNGKRLEAAGHPQQLPARDRLLGLFEVQVRPCFDLNRHKVSVVVDHQVNLSRSGSIVARQNASARLDEMGLRQPLPPPAELDVVPFHPHPAAIVAESAGARAEIRRRRRVSGPMWFAVMTPRAAGRRSGSWFAAAARAVPAVEARTTAR